MSTLVSTEIHIDRLRLYARHGVLPQEREVGAEFVVTLTAKVDATDEALLHDHLEGTVDYGQLVATMQHEMDEPSRLLEHAAMRMAHALLRDFPMLTRVTLLLEKVNPPLGVLSEGVGVEIVLDR